MAMKVPGGTNSETLLTKPAMVRPNWYSAPKDLDAHTKPNWDRWLNMNTVPLWQAVALSCGIEPEYLVDGTDDEYKKRLVIAISHLEPGGWLSHITADARPHVTLVRLADIRAVAERCVPPWSLPEEFPCVDAATLHEADAGHQPSSPRRRLTWMDVAGHYIVEVMRAGQYPTCKQLYRELEAKAGPDSPFDKGTGANHGSLFVRDITQTLTMKTLQNHWQTLRQMAQE